MVAHNGAETAQDMLKLLLRSLSATFCEMA